MRAVYARRALVAKRALRAVVRAAGAYLVRPRPQASAGLSIMGLGWCRKPALRGHAALSGRSNTQTRGPSRVGKPLVSSIPALWRASRVKRERMLKPFRVRVDFERDPWRPTTILACCSRAARSGSSRVNCERRERSRGRAPNRGPRRVGFRLDDARESFVEKSEVLDRRE